MEIIIKEKPEEIAALILEIQKRLLNKRKTVFGSISEYEKHLAESDAGESHDYVD